MRVERIFCDGCGFPADSSHNWRRLLLHHEQVEVIFCAGCTTEVMRNVVSWAVPPPKDHPHPEDWPSWKSAPEWAHSDEARDWFQRIMDAAPKRKQAEPKRRK